MTGTEGFVGTELHAGIDFEKVVVSPYPLKMRSGLARRERTGMLVESVCRAPSGRGREERVTFAARLALPLLLVSAVLAAAGFSWWLAVGGSAVLVGVVWRRQARAAQEAVFAVPRDDASCVLWSVPERAAFAGALDGARRVRRTWPALGDMIDPVLADRSLTRAIGELAEVLGRRQELRRVREELAGVRDADIPVDSPARVAADRQRERADEAWREAGDAANRILGSIDAAARAGESFIRERQVAATARHAERTLARVAGVPAAVESGPDLAGRTEAVIDAYRDLART
ncbi:hypothetical protein [Actinoplanes philippinensis]|uniref:hypothetical protein n=1 Tax=Actinoplanes philippinensis TaxID=35752 RepID=UPI0033F7675C